MAIPTIQKKLVQLCSVISILLHPVKVILFASFNKAGPSAGCVQPLHTNRSHGLTEVLHMPPHEQVMDATNSWTLRVF